MECYKAESNNPPQRGIILQKDEKVLLFLGYTTNIEYVKDIVKWFIGEKK